MLSTSESKDEVALTAFKGTCRSCGAFGHKSSDCKKATKNSDRTSSNAGGKSDVTCGYCHKKGHREEKCWAKQKAEKTKEKEKTGKSESADIALVTAFDQDEIAISAIVRDRDFFLCDSGATSHMTNNIDGMFDLQEINKTVQVGNDSEC